MLWENLKKHVAREIFTRIIEGRSFSTMASILFDGLAADKPVSQKDFKAYADKAYDIVMDWDIRAVERLREVVGFFPKTLSTGSLIAYMDEKSDWIVDRL